MYSKSIRAKKSFFIPKTLCKFLHKESRVMYYLASFSYGGVDLSNTDSSTAPRALNSEKMFTRNSSSTYFFRSLKASLDVSKRSTSFLGYSKF